MSLNRIKKEIRKEVIEPATDSRKLFRLNRFISSRYTVIIFLILLDILLFGAINYIVNVLSHAFDWFVTQEKISYGIINIFPNLATKIIIRCHYLIWYLEINLLTHRNRLFQGWNKEKQYLLYPEEKV